jgi:ribosomal protein S21
MSLEVSLHQGESQEALVPRFQRMVQMSGVLREVKANRHFITKSPGCLHQSQEERPTEVPTGILAIQ